MFEFLTKVAFERKKVTHAKQLPVATATAEPPELPPAMWPSSDRQMFLVGPKMESTAPEPILNSSRFVLPMSTAPASSKRVNGVALYEGTKFSSILKLLIKIVSEWNDEIKEFGVS